MERLHHRRCPECGADCPADATRCWLCQRELTPGKVLSTASAEKTPLAGPSSQFSIATILLVMTLVAVCLGVFRISPGFGLAFLAISTPALIRTLIVGVQNKRVGQSLSIGEKLTAFAASLGIMVLVGIAAVVAFQIACWGTCGLLAAVNPPTGDEEVLLWTSVGIGSLAALAVGIWILWLTRPRRR